MNNDNEFIVYDFDSTLTTTDTIKFTIVCLLCFSPWRSVKVLQLYIKFKKNKTSSEERKHAVIAALISGHTVKWVNVCMNIYVIIVRLFIHGKIWKMMMAQKREGNKIVIATASPHFAVHAFMKKYEIDVIGTQYQLQHERFTGVPDAPIPFGEGKLSAVKEYMKKHAIPSIKCAYSDSLSDMPVLSAAQEGFIVSKNGRIENITTMTIEN